MENVFTPVDYKTKKRLKFNTKEVKVLEGHLWERGSMGIRAVVEIKGKKYKVVGKSCGLPNCKCDAYLKNV